MLHLNSHQRCHNYAARVNNFFTSSFLTTQQIAAVILAKESILEDGVKAIKQGCGQLPLAVYNNTLHC
ncbi:Nonribosomal peptide synthetase [Trichinella pseudospiralis]